MENFFWTSVLFIPNLKYPQHKKEINLQMEYFVALRGLRRKSQGYRISMRIKSKSTKQKLVVRYHDKYMCRGIYAGTSIFVPAPA